MHVRPDEKGRVVAMVVTAKAKLDEQVERYFAAHPLTMKYIQSYSVHREVNNVTRITLDIYIDQTEFDKEEE